MLKAWRCLFLFDYFVFYSNSYTGSVCPCISCRFLSKNCKKILVGVVHFYRFCSKISFRSDQSKKIILMLELAAKPTFNMYQHCINIIQTRSIYVFSERDIIISWQKMFIKQKLQDINLFTLFLYHTFPQIVSKSFLVWLLSVNLGIWFNGNFLNNFLPNQNAKFWTKNWNISAFKVNSECRSKVGIFSGHIKLKNGQILYFTV